MLVGGGRAEELSTEPQPLNWGGGEGSAEEGGVGGKAAHLPLEE